MATGNVNIGPQDGWVRVTATPTTALTSLRISAFPHTHPIYVYGGTVAPTDSNTGILVCHHPFELRDDAATANLDSFWVRTTNNVPNSKNMDGRVRVDVYVSGAAAL